MTAAPVAAPSRGAGVARDATASRAPAGARGRPALVLPALVALVAGLWAGLVRVGWGLPPLAGSLATAHGPLMVGGFLGTAVTLERAVALVAGLDRAGGAEAATRSGRRPLPAVALGRRAALVFPALTGLGALGLVAGLGGPWAPLLLAAGSGGLVGMSVTIARRQPALHHVTLALGALAWLVGNALWLAGWPVFRVVPWWAAFLVLTIAGERLELSRVLLPPRGARVAFAALAAALVAGVALTAVAPAAGDALAGAALVATAGWLLRWDVARRTVRQRGLTRFIAAAMLSGYVWLGVAGALFVREAGSLVAGPAYDAALHALFLGFVFSMIFGHAPIILPAVARVTVRFGRSFYAHLALLHVSLALRLGGDLVGSGPARRWGALLNAAAILLFVATTARSAGRRASPVPSHRRDA